MKGNFKKLSKRTLALVLSLVMCLGMLPGTAWATEQTAAEGGTITSGTAENNDVEIKKYAVRDLQNPGVWNVTMEVTAKKDLTAKPLELVLVLDYSSSMKGNRMATAKKAANDLLTDLANLHRDISVSVVIFDANANTLVPLKPLEGNLDPITSAINGIDPDRGTNISGGLIEAGKQIATPDGKKPNRQWTLKNQNAAHAVVLLSDGLPSSDDDEFNSAYDGSTDLLKQDYRSGKDTATKLKALGIEIFSIGFTMDVKALEFIASPPTQDHYKRADNATELEKAFDEIASQLVAMVTDPMGSDVSYTGREEQQAGNFVTTDKHLTWNANLNKIDQGHTSAITYNVNLDQTKLDAMSAGELGNNVALNGKAVFTYVANGQEAEDLEFKIPQDTVKVAQLTTTYDVNNTTVTTGDYAPKTERGIVGWSTAKPSAEFTTATYEVGIQYDINGKMVYYIGSEYTTGAETEWVGNKVTISTSVARTLVHKFSETPVQKNLTNITKVRITDDQGLPSEVTAALNAAKVTINYSDKQPVVGEDHPVTLLYAITVTGEQGAQYLVTEEQGATFIQQNEVVIGTDEATQAPTASGKVGTSGKVTLYAYRTFTAAEEKVATDVTEKSYIVSNKVTLKPGDGTKLPDKAPEITDKEETPATPAAPDLTITKTAKVNGTVVTDQTKVKADDVIDYTITVENPGNVDLTDVEVTDVMFSQAKDSLVKINDTPADVTDNKVTIGNLAQGTVAVITYSYTVTVGDMTNPAQKISNTAKATSKEIPNGEDTTKDVPVDPPVSALKVEKTAGRTLPIVPGTDVTYTVMVKNTGNMDLSSVVVHDDMFPALVALDDTSVNVVNKEVTIASLAAGDTAIITYTTPVAYPANGTSNVEQVTNTATASARDPADSTKTISGEDSAVVRVFAHKLNIQKTVSPTGQVKVGDIVTYTITVTNSGGCMENNVVITDNVPAELDIQSCTATGGLQIARTGNEVTASVPSLTQGAAVTLTITAKVLSAGESKNTAKVKSDDILPPVPSNEVTITTETRKITDIKKERLTGTLPEELQNNQALHQVDLDSQVQVGSGHQVMLLYSITVTGDEGAHYEVTDDNAVYVGGARMIGEIGEAGSAVIYVTRTFGSDDVQNGKVTNTAYVGPTDPDTEIDPEKDPDGDNKLEDKEDTRVEVQYYTVTYQFEGSVPNGVTEPKDDTLYENGTPFTAKPPARTSVGIYYGSILIGTWKFSGWKDAPDTITENTIIHGTWTYEAAPSTGQLDVTKTPDKREAAVGEKVTWQITVSNNTDKALTGLSLVDTLTGAVHPDLDLTGVTGYYTNVGYEPPADDPVQSMYTVTVYYVYEDGSQAMLPYSETLDTNKSYTVMSPVIEGYTPDKEIVTGHYSMTSEDKSNIEVTVTYYPTTVDWAELTPAAPVEPTPEPAPEGPTSEEPTPEEPETASLEEYALAGRVSAKGFDLNPGAVVVFEVSYTVQPGDGETLSNVVQVVGPDKPIDKNDPIPVHVKHPDLEVTKTRTSADTALVGEDITWTITVTNNGDGNAYNVVLTDARANWTTTIGTLAAGSTVTYTVTYTASTADVGTLVNTVTTTYREGPDGPDVPGPTATDEGTVIEEPEVPVTTYTVTYLRADNTNMTTDVVTGYLRTGEAIPGAPSVTANDGYVLGGWRLISGTPGPDGRIGATDLVYSLTVSPYDPYIPPYIPVTPPVTIPDTPTPLAPSPDEGTTIIDEDVPLAGAIGLNDTDHFAYIIGYDDDTVKPLNNITRAEVATIFFRLMTETYRISNWSTENSFTDVKSGDWFNNAISTCANAGALKGYTDGSFKPNASITRAEFAAIAARFLSDEYTDEGVGDFSDTGDHWAAADIRRAVKAGWIKGDGNKFDPDKPITRAEVMTMVNRMLDRVPDADHMLPTMKKWIDNPEGTWYYEAVQEATNEHDYERDELGVVETWTELLTVRDWKALEAEWAANGGASASQPDTQPTEDADSPEDAEGAGGETA